MARAAVDLLPTISITSPSVRPSSSINLSARRAKPRPLSAGGRLATWTLRDLTRSIVSASGMFAPDPRPHSPVGNGGKSEWVHLSSQYLIAPAILRTTDRGAKRVLTAVTLFIQP